MEDGKTILPMRLFSDGLLEGSSDSNPSYNTTTLLHVRTTVT